VFHENCPHIKERVQALTYLYPSELCANHSSTEPLRNASRSPFAIRIARRSGQFLSYNLAFCLLTLFRVSFEGSGHGSFGAWIQVAQVHWFCSMFSITRRHCLFEPLLCQVMSLRGNRHHGRDKLVLIGMRQAIEFLAHDAHCWLKLLTPTLGHD